MYSIEYIGHRHKRFLSREVHSSLARWRQKSRFFLNGNKFLNGISGWRMDSQTSFSRLFLIFPTTPQADLRSSDTRNMKRMWLNSNEDRERIIASFDKKWATLAQTRKSPKIQLQSQGGHKKARVAIQMDTALTWESESRDIFAKLSTSLTISDCETAWVLRSVLICHHLYLGVLTNRWGRVIVLGRAYRMGMSSSLYRSRWRSDPPQPPEFSMWSDKIWFTFR